MTPPAASTARLTPSLTRSASALSAALCGALAAVGLLAGDTDVGGVLLGGGSGGPLTEIRWLVFALGAAPLAFMLTEREGLVVDRSVALAVSAVLTFVAYGAASALWSPADGALVDGKLVGLALVGLYAVVVAVAASGPRADVFAVWFWRSVAGVTLVLALIGLLSLGGPGGRVAVLGGGPNVYGRLMGLGVYALLLVRLPHRYRTLGISAGGLLAVMMVLSGSRGALVAFAASAAVVLVLVRPRLRAVLKAVPLVAVVGAALYHTGVYDLIEASVQERLVRLLIEEQYTAGRDVLYGAALAMGLDAPVLGAGLAGFSTSELHRYPHNLFLEAFAEGGGVGLLLVTAALALCGRTLVRTAAGRTDLALRLGLWSYLLVAAMFSGELYDSRLVFVLPLLGAAQSLTPHGPPAPRPGRPPAGRTPPAPGPRLQRRRRAL